MAWKSRELQNFELQQETAAHVAQSRAVAVALNLSTVYASELFNIASLGGFPFGGKRRFLRTECVLNKHCYFASPKHKQTGVWSHCRC